MTSRLENATADAKILGAFLSRARQVLSALTIVALIAIIIVQQFRFDDRWTETDHDAWVKEHAAKTKYLVETYGLNESEQIQLSTAINELRDQLKEVDRTLQELSITTSYIKGNQEQILVRLEKLNGKD